MAWKLISLPLSTSPQMPQRIFGKSNFPPTLAPSSIGGIVAAMKHVLIALLGLVVAVGCGTTPQGINQTSKVKIGTPIWEFRTRGVVHSDPAIGSDGTVYVGSKDKKLYAIKTDSKGLAKSPWPMLGQNARHTGRVMKQK